MIWLKSITFFYDKGVFEKMWILYAEHICIQKIKIIVVKAMFYAIIKVVGNNLLTKLLQNVHSKAQLCAAGGHSWQKCYKKAIKIINDFLSVTTVRRRRTNCGKYQT